MIHLTRELVPLELKLSICFSHVSFQKETFHFKRKVVHFKRKCLTLKATCSFEAETEFILKETLRFKWERIHFKRED